MAGDGSEHGASGWPAGVWGTVERIPLPPLIDGGCALDRNDWHLFPPRLHSRQFRRERWCAVPAEPVLP